MFMVEASVLRAEVHTPGCVKVYKGAGPLKHVFRCGIYIKSRPHTGTEQLNVVKCHIFLIQK